MQSPPPTKAIQRLPLGEQVRKIADQLKAETDLQVKVTSRILGAAAQIANNHDQLIGEVVEMVEEDLEYRNEVSRQPYTVALLKQQFKTLGEAKSHFGVKATSWAILAEKLNHGLISPPKPPESDLTTFSRRLDTIDQELRALRTDTQQILVLLQQLMIDQP